MSRTPAQIDAAKLLNTTELGAVTSEVRQFPPGYMQGGRLRLNSLDKFTVDPMAINIAGKSVQTFETTIIGNEHWVVGGVQTPRVPGYWYYLYIGSDGKFAVSSNEPVYSEQYLAYYHPIISNLRAIGKLYTAWGVSDVTQIGDIAANLITADKMAADSITTDKLIVGAITSDKIADGTITGDNIAPGTIVAENIAVGAVRAREVSFGTNPADVAVYEDHDAADADAHIFDLSQPDCVSNTGVLPASGREIVYAPATSIDEALKEYPNPWSPRLYGQSEAIFAARTNLVTSPEEITSTAGWTPSTVAGILTDSYVRNKRLTRVTCTVAGFMYRDVEPTISTPSIQCIMKKGTGLTGALRLYDRTAATQRGSIIVTWATGVVSSANGLTNLDSEWIDANTVWVSGTAAGVIPANDNEILFYPGGAGLYTDVTAVQVEDAAYPSPYIDKFRWPTQVRPAMSANYAVTMPGKFVFKIKIHPWFAYTSGIYHTVGRWYSAATSYFKIQWDFASDKFYIVWRDTGNERVLTSSAFMTDVNQELILFGAVNLDSGGIGDSRFSVFLENGIQFSEDLAWDNAPDVKASTFSEFQLGHAAAAIHVDSQISYAKFWTWDGAALGTLNNEADIDHVTASLTPLFSWEGEDYDVGYKPTGKQGAVGLFKATTNLVTDPEDMTGTAWAETNITPTLSDYYIDGKRFSKLLATAADGYSSQTIAFTGNAVKSIQCFLRRGTGTTTTLVLRDTTAPDDRLRIVVTWATKAFTETTGSVSQYMWLNDDILWIACLTTSVTAASTNSLRIEIDTDATYSYITAIQAEDSVYPTPYTPTTRAAGVLQYPLALPRKFTALFWLRPWFNYDTANDPIFLTWYVAANNVFLIYYVPATDQITVGWIDGGTARYLHGPTLNSAALLNQNIMVAATIDLDGGQTGSMLKVYAGATIGSDKDWGAAPDTKTTDFPTLRVGYDHLDPAGVADSFLTDLLILPGSLLTEVQCDEHFNKTRPWYSSSEVASNNKQVRIDRNGIRLHNSQLAITDWRNRQILISNRDGLLARDAAGKRIHDIPDAVILSGMIYGGHVLWKEAPDYLGYHADTFNDNAATFAELSAVSNVDISAYVGGNTNVKGALVFVQLQTQLAFAKIALGTKAALTAFYGLTYAPTATSTGYNKVKRIFCRCTHTMAGNQWDNQQTSHALVPVVYNGTTPYISWWHYLNFEDMVAVNGVYTATTWLWLLGLVI